MKFFDVEQNTDEWLDMRAGKLTSSNLAKVMANEGKAFGEPAKKYAVDIAVERALGRSLSSNYSNDHMDRGHTQEPIARMLYEQDRFCDVTNGGFFDLGDIGCSPDGLVGDDGVIEIKSVIPSIHYANVKRQGIDPAYKWQVIGNVHLTGRNWIDLISYCEQFPEGKQLYVCRVYRSKTIDEFARMQARVEEFRALIAATEKVIEASSYITEAA